MAKKSVLALSALWFALGCFVGPLAVDLLNGEPLFGPLVSLAVSSKHGAKYEAFERLVTSRHLNTKLDPDKLLEGCYRGLVEAVGDRYSSYHSTDDQLVMDKVRGDAAGIGITGDFDTAPVIIDEVTPDGGAAKAGLRKGDAIVAVDRQILKPQQMKESLALLRGKAGSTVKLTIRRDTRTYEVKAVRQLLEPEPFRIETIAYNGATVAVIRLKLFSDLATEHWPEKVSYLSRLAPDGYVLDLRGNLGGDEWLAAEIVGSFVGPAVVSLSENDGQRSPLEISPRIVLPRRPMTILTDGHSASASEVVAAALRYYGIAVTVGEKTCGKGVGQTFYDLPGAGNLGLTTFRWLTPGGESIDKVGIKPDLAVAPASCESCVEHDAQLDRAIRHVVSL